jgi:hypothetical protein
MADDSTDEKLSEDMIDATLADSFPASDPPSWTLGREKRKHSKQTENSAETKRSSTSRAEGVGVWKLYYYPP